MSGDVAVARRSTRRGRRLRLRLGFVAAAGAVAAVTAVPASATSASDTVRVSVGAAGRQANASTTANIGISTSGRFLAFVSTASNLVARDANGRQPDLFLRDNVTKTTRLIDRDEQGRQPSLDVATGIGSFLVTPVTSADASTAAYIFQPEDPSREYPTSIGYVEDLKTGTVKRLPQFEQFAVLLAISANGRYIVAQNSDAQLGDTTDLLYDKKTGTFTTLAVDQPGRPGYDGLWSDASISADGRYIAYTQPNADGSRTQVWELDRNTGISMPVSASTTNGDSSNAMVSNSGRYVAFQSTASNLVPADTNRVSDVFVRDVQGKKTRRVSISTAGLQGNKASYPQSLSADGQTVAFTSAATNLVAGDTNNHTDVFTHSLITGATRRVSVTNRGLQANRGSLAPLVSGDGQHVSFISNATNLVPGDTNASPDLFVHEMAPSR